MKGATAEEQAVIAEAQEQNARVLVHVSRLLNRDFCFPDALFSGR
jgi:hypothetical protein